MPNIDGKLNGSSKRLALNTIYLYIMTISTYVLNLLTIPYLTRVLGPTIYGEIGLAVGYMSYIQIVLDFGFILSATQLISERRADYQYIGEIISAVTFVKIILSFIILTILFILYKINFFDGNIILLLVIYLCSYLFSALLPDYFYRGIENMKITSVRTVMIKIIFTMLIFVLVKNEDDVIFVPISTLIGNICALLFTSIDLIRHYKIKFVIPPAIRIKKLVVLSIPFFISRFASTFYQALDIVILGKYYGASPIVGYYSSCDKIIALAKTGASPIADSLYPYMLENKNFKLIKKIAMIVMPLITFFVIIVGIFAEQICVLLFGVAYREAGIILRLLLPIAWIVLPNYIVAFPVMSPLGLVRYTNMSNVIGMAVQITGLIIFWLLNIFNIYTICILTSITEMVVFAFRVCVVIIYLYKQKGQK